jgi:ABC-type spermidine/putrescine transport system permease subunit II
MAPGIAAAAFFAFLTSFDELIIALFLSTPRVMTLPKRMWDGIRFEVDPTIAAVSTLLVFLTILMLVVLALAQRSLRSGQRGAG